MPRVMWYTVALGALVNMIFLWPFDLRIGTHLLLGALVSFFTATMICLIAILDRTFKGEIGVSPEAFQLVYQQMLQDQRLVALLPKQRDRASRRPSRRR
jgi:hypothetical protein